MLWLSPLSAADPPVYQNNFQGAALGDLPDEFLILDGFFEVKQEGDNKFLELPGAPLGTFGILFGDKTLDEVAVSARIHGTNTKRRYPAFGVGLNGLVGYRLMLAPAKRQLELYRDDDVVAAVDYQWEPGSWTHFKLQSRKAGPGTWRVEGKIWAADTKEPKDWIVHFVDKQAPYEGQASIWGKPFSGTPIRYDDLVIYPSAP